jgi:hypothetical protein
VILVTRTKLNRLVSRETLLRFELAGIQRIERGSKLELCAYRPYLGFFLCIFLAYPERGQGAVIMTNKASDQIGIFYEILLSIAAEYDWPLAH